MSRVEGVEEAESKVSDSRRASHSQQSQSTDTEEKARATLETILRSEIGIGRDSKIREEYIEYISYIIHHIYVLYVVNKCVGTP